VNITESDGLVNNHVCALCIDEENGVLWAGTVAGLNRIPAPFLSQQAEPFSSVLTYPNPFNPQRFPTMYFGSERKGLPAGTSKIRIFDVSGQLVFESEELNYQRQFFWDGKTQNGEMAASGIYYFLIYNEENGNTASGKFALIH